MDEIVVRDPVLPARAPWPRRVMRFDPSGPMAFDFDRVLVEHN